MSLERMPNGRRLETNVEDETCPVCRGKGTTGDSPDNVRTCRRCDGRGKVRGAS
jgi:DnaJ-class molecular chaperone